MMNKNGFFRKYVITYLGWAVIIGLAIYGLLMLSKALIGGYRYYHVSPVAAQEAKKDKAVKKDITTEVKPKMENCHVININNDSGYVMYIRYYVPSTNSYELFDDQKNGTQSGIQYTVKSGLQFQLVVLETEVNGLRIKKSYDFKRRNVMGIPTVDEWDGRSK